MKSPPCEAQQISDIVSQEIPDVQEEKMGLRNAAVGECGEAGRIVPWRTPGLEQEVH